LQRVPDIILVFEQLRMKPCFRGSRNVRRAQHSLISERCESFAARERNPRRCPALLRSRKSGHATGGHVFCPTFGISVRTGCNPRRVKLEINLQFVASLPFSFRARGLRAVLPTANHSLFSLGPAYFGFWFRGSRTVLTSLPTNPAMLLPRRAVELVFTAIARFRFAHRSNKSEGREILDHIRALLQTCVGRWALERWAWKSSAASRTVRSIQSVRATTLAPSFAIPSQVKLSGTTPYNARATARNEARPGATPFVARTCRDECKNWPGRFRQFPWPSTQMARAS